jgi:hypothetical protein
LAYTGDTTYSGVTMNPSHPRPLPSTTLRGLAALSALVLLALAPACEDDKGTPAADAATPPRDGGSDTAAASSG